MDKQIMQRYRIVVMGGSFNPPTIAHFKLLTHALDVLQAEKGIFVPSSDAHVMRKMRKGEDEKKRLRVTGKAAIENAGGNVRRR